MIYAHVSRAKEEDMQSMTMTEWIAEQRKRMKEVHPQSAPDFLQAAKGHMEARAATYDEAGGERSMAKTIAAFNAVAGRDLSEPEGWLLMAILKQVRLFARPGFHQDSAEDAIAYLALLAESKQTINQPQG